MLMMRIGITNQVSLLVDQSNLLILKKIYDLISERESALAGSALQGIWKRNDSIAGVLPDRPPFLVLLSTDRS